MRLLRVSSVFSESGRLELADFIGQNLPVYSILSHTWTDDEVLYEDIRNDTAHHRAAYRKLEGAAEQAREDGNEYIWIDTCCMSSGLLIQGFIA